jgi:acyl-CoA reductase-like NAD-dependent aldehyde dehydrogenase
MDTAELDKKIATLQAHKDEWARLDLREKIAIARRLMQGFYKVGERQVAKAIEAKRIPADSPLVGEEWLGGPLITVRTLRFTIKSLEDVAAGKKPTLKPGTVRTLPNGQVAVKVFPNDKWDSILFKDFEAEVWMEPGVTEATLPSTQAVFYDKKDPTGKVALVLGAGNVASIGPLDVIYKLFVEGQVCLLKMNPVNEYLGPFIEEACAELIERGFLHVAYGGADVGAYLCAHEGIEEIHITGSDKTHDAIVYGVGAEGVARKQADDRKINKRITSELGNVSPVIVVPGQWSQSDLDFHAENIATQLANNGAFNCNAARVIITHKQWPQRRAFLDALNAAFSRIPQRYPYYPGARDRFAMFTESVKDRDQVKFFGKKDDQWLPWALVEDVDPNDKNNLLFTQESFCGVQCETALDAADTGEFIANAVRFCNDTLWGTLNAAILIHPDTERQHKKQLDQAVADLRYGSVVINHWPALAYGFGVTTWGAFPGHTYQNIQSGIGVVHNALLFDKAQKSVIHGPFRVFPRPPWFVTNRQTHHIAPRLVDFEMNPSLPNLGRIIWYAVRG